MKINEAKEVFINRGFVLTDDGNNTIYDPDKWRESVNVISKWLERQELEQEPFMNKPCVAHQVCHEDKVKVLDKIRAEIEQAADKQFQIAMGVADLNERYAHIQMENAYRHSLNVIDKYRK